MDRHTTFRTGGPALYFLVIETRKELAQVLAWLQEEALPWFLLGNGSNLLVGDRGYRGAILHLAGEFLKTEIDEATIRCGAGAMLSAVSRSAMEAGLTGLEFASGIPGTIGGAVRMNAGAYNGEIAGVTESVEVMEPDGRCRVYNREEMAFGYRTSIVKTKPCVVLSTVLKLQKGDRSEISATMQELSAKRREKQPLEYPSAGSTFKRPEGYFAGKLIMEHRKLFKNVCANVDFYSGFVYSMLGIPEELFTPIFAIARMPGWSAHRLEELINANKIIRPAYKYVGHHTDFVAFDER